MGIVCQSFEHGYQVAQDAQDAVHLGRIGSRGLREEQQGLQLDQDIFERDRLQFALPGEDAGQRRQCGLRRFTAELQVVEKPRAVTVFDAGSARHVGLLPEIVPFRQLVQRKLQFFESGAAR